jgi:hypothetical protein
MVTLIYDFACVVHTTVLSFYLVADKALVDLY